MRGQFREALKSTLQQTRRAAAFDLSDRANGQHDRRNIQPHFIERIGRDDVIEVAMFLSVQPANRVIPRLGNRLKHRNVTAAIRVMDLRQPSKGILHLLLGRNWILQPQHALP